MSNSASNGIENGRLVWNQRHRGGEAMVRMSNSASNGIDNDGLVQNQRLRGGKAMVLGR